MHGRTLDFAPVTPTPTPTSLKGSGEAGQVFAGTEREHLTGLAAGADTTALCQKVKDHLTREWKSATQELTSLDIETRTPTPLLLRIPSPRGAPAE